MEPTTIQAPVEATAQPAQTTEPKGPSDETRLAVLARKERELRDREAKMKDVANLSELRELAKKDQKELFKRLGLTDTDLTPQAEPESDDPLDGLRKEIEALRSKEAQREIDSFKADIRKTLEAGGQEYELVTALGGADEVYNLIEAHYAETGEVLDAKQAAAQLETYLLEQAKKIVKAQKLKGLLTPEDAVKENKAEEKKPAPSLNPSLAAPAAQPRTFDARTIEESKRRAAALIKWDD